MYSRNSNLTLTNCTFIENVSHRGGGMCNIISSAILTGCTFSGNVATTRGGGMKNTKSALELIGCAFNGNTAGLYGGGIHDEGSALELTGCAFSGNTAERGGGMHISQNRDIKLTGCTFTGNYLTNKHGGDLDKGGGIYSCLFYSPSNKMSIINCILWGDSPDEIRLCTGTPVITYSNIQGGWPGEGNIDADPLFAALGYWHDNNTPDDPEDDYWVDGDYHLKSQAGRFDPATQAWVKDDVTSPCIDAGDPLSPVMYEPHPRGCIVNMGAYGGTEEASKSPFGCSYEADGE